MKKPTTGFLPGPVLILLGTLCFSTTGLTQAMAPQGATPIVIATVRMLVSGTALLLWCVLSKRLPIRGNWPVKHLLGCIGTLLLFQLCFFQGMLLSGVAIGTVVSIGVTPISGALLGWIFLGERPPWTWYVATLLAMTGLLLINDIGNAAFKPAVMFLPVVAGICYSAFIVFSKEVVSKQPPEAAVAAINLGVGLLLLPALLIFPSEWPVEWLFSTRGVLVALNLGIVTAAMAFSLSLAGFKTTRTATASTLSLGEPLLAAALGVCVLSEPLTMASATGMALMLVGVLVMVLIPSKKQGIQKMQDVPLA